MCSDLHGERTGLLMAKDLLLVQALTHIFPERSPLLLASTQESKRSSSYLKDVTNYVIQPKGGLLRGGLVGRSDCGGLGGRDAFKESQGRSHQLGRAREEAR